MNSIIEVPVFTKHKDLSELLFAKAENIHQKSYNDFIVYDYILEPGSSVYFYLMNNVPATNDALLMDQIIAKAPFSFFAIDPKESLQTDSNVDLLKLYEKSYSTPPIILLIKDDAELYKKYTNEESGSEPNHETILFDEKDSNALREALLVAINITSPANI